VPVRGSKVEDDVNKKDEVEGIDDNRTEEIHLMLKRNLVRNQDTGNQNQHAHHEIPDHSELAVLFQHHRGLPLRDLEITL
jgi:hypothetical protein